MAGLLTDEVVAAKEVMAQLSLPRFVRMGDRATLSATLFNLTGKTLEGKATMEVFEPGYGRGPLERDGEGGDGGGIGYGGVFCLHAFGQCVLAGLSHNLRSRGACRRGTALSSYFGGQGMADADPAFRGVARGGYGDTARRFVPRQPSWRRSTAV